MAHTYARPVRDLRNNYAEIAALANAGNRIIITNNGREEVMIIGKEEYQAYEGFVHSAFIKRELAKASEYAKRPDAKWYTEEESDAFLDAMLSEA
jgi:prevent-host-death family protein